MIIKISLMFALFVTLGFGVGYFIGLIIKDSMGVFSWWYILLFIVSFYMSVILHTFFHEFGHFVCAKIRGWNFVSFMLFGLVLTKKNNRFNVSRSKVPGALGQCLMEPPADGDTGFGIALYNAGGVAMNLLLLLMALIVFILGWDIIPDYIVLSVIPFILVGAFMTFVNAIPLEISGMPNDGMNIVSLHKDKFSLEAFLYSMRIVAALQKGNRISNFSDRYFTDDKLVDFSNPIHVMAVGIDYSRALDLRDFDKARSLMGEINSHSALIPKIYRLEYGMENIFLNLVSEGFRGEVKTQLNNETRKYIEGAASFRPSALRVRYALALLYEKDEEKAGKLYSEFIKLCSKYYLPGEALSEKDLVDSLSVTA